MLKSPVIFSDPVPCVSHFSPQFSAGRQSQVVEKSPLKCFANIHYLLGKVPPYSRCSALFYTINYELSFLAHHCYHMFLTDLSRVQNCLQFSIYNIFSHLLLFPKSILYTLFSCSLKGKQDSDSQGPPEESNEKLISVGAGFYLQCWILCQHQVLSGSKGLQSLVSQLSIGDLKDRMQMLIGGNPVAGLDLSILGFYNAASSGKVGLGNGELAVE